MLLFIQSLVARGTVVCITLVEHSHSIAREIVENWFLLHGISQCIFYIFYIRYSIIRTKYGS